MKGIKSVFWVVSGLLIGQAPLSAQKLKKADKVLASNIALDDQNLSRDTTQLEQTGIAREWERTSFARVTHVDEGKIISSRCLLSLDGKTSGAGEDFFPLAGSPDGHAEGSSGISLNEGGLPWIYDLKYDLEAGRGNPTFDIRKKLGQKAVEAKNKGATALLLYNSSKLADALTFDGKDKQAVYPIPVVYINKTLSSRVFKDPTAYVDVSLTVALDEKAYDVHSVEGFIDNGASRTVVIEASLDIGGGGAALIELAKLLKQGGFKKHNFLVLGFSKGQERAALLTCLIDQHALSADSVDYVVNIDQLGRMDPMIPELKVVGYHVPRGKDNIFSTVTDPHFQVVYRDSLGDRSVTVLPELPRFCFSTTATESVPMGNNYNGEALVVRYIFKAMEAADKQ